MRACTFIDCSDLKLCRISYITRENHDINHMNSPKVFVSIIKKETSSVITFVGRMESRPLLHISVTFLFGYITQQQADVRWTSQESQKCIAIQWMIFRSTQNRSLSLFGL